MADFNGLNGTIMLNGNIEVGTVPGDRHGYAARTRLPVTIDVRIERLERRETYQTTQHEGLTRPLGLSVMSNVWQPGRGDIVTGGATREPLRDVAEHGTPGRFWDPDKLTLMARLGDQWHANDMTAACAHQEVVYEEKPYHRPSLDLTPPCPVTGYRYGTDWLITPLSTPVVDTLLDLLAGPIDNRNVYIHPDLTRSI